MVARVAYPGLAQVHVPFIRTQLSSSFSMCFSAAGLCVVRQVPYLTLGRRRPLAIALGPEALEAVSRIAVILICMALFAGPAESASLDLLHPARSKSCVQSCKSQRNQCVLRTKNLSRCAAVMQKCLERCIRRR